MGLAARGKPMWGVQFHPEVSSDILLQVIRPQLIFVYPYPTQSICSTYGAQILNNFFKLSLAHFPQSPSSPTPNLPSSILELSTTYQRPRSRPETESSMCPIWERRTIELESPESLSPQQVFEQLVKGQNKLGEVWLESARVSSSSTIFPKTV